MKTFREVFLEDWVPHIFTGSIGAAAIIWGVPWAQDSFARASSASEKRLEIYEQITREVVRYCSNLREYRDYSLTPAGEFEQLSTQMKADLRKKFEESRNATVSSFDKVVETIPTAFVLFGADAQKSLQEFEAWARSVQTLPPEEMPSTDEIAGIRDQLLQGLREDVKL